MCKFTYVLIVRFYVCSYPIFCVIFRYHLLFFQCFNSIPLRFEPTTFWFWVLTFTTRPQRLVFLVNWISVFWTSFSAASVYKKLYLGKIIINLKISILKHWSGTTYLKTLDIISYVVKSQKKNYFVILFLTTLILAMPYFKWIIKSWRKKKTYERGVMKRQF